MNSIQNIIYILGMALCLSCQSNAQHQQTNANKNTPNTMSKTPYAVQKTDAEWKKELTEQEYYVLREQGTEHPYTGKYNLHFEGGTYLCKGCKTPLFKSNQKFKSNCGWPSFDDAIEGTIEYRKDTSHGMQRTEIVCAICGGHLGHVFNDGPTPTGLRYCVNSISLDFSDEK